MSSDALAARLAGELTCKEWPGNPTGIIYRKIAGGTRGGSRLDGGRGGLSQS